MTTAPLNPYGSDANTPFQVCSLLTPDEVNAVIGSSNAEEGAQNNATNGTCTWTGSGGKSILATYGPASVYNPSQYPTTTPVPNLGQQAFSANMPDSIVVGTQTAKGNSLALEYVGGTQADLPALTQLAQTAIKSI